ncbi:DHHC palmitoyltransferase [Novymonas esmeraldas]|uniref:Palmitoyltransferase n=1 Tax=Novymonas esmeraldas TaxID=1808958 RepID=A0AAW0EM52_9TRYP
MSDATYSPAASIGEEAFSLAAPEHDGGATPPRPSTPPLPSSATPSPRRGRLTTAPMIPAANAETSEESTRRRGGTHEEEEAAAFDSTAAPADTLGSSFQRMHLISRPPRTTPSTPSDATAALSGTHSAAHRSPEALGMDTADVVVPATAPQPATAAPFAAVQSSAPPSSTVSADSPLSLTKSCTNVYPAEGGSSNPLKRHGAAAAAEAELSPSSSGADCAKGGGGDDVAFSLSRIAAPTTADEYYARVAEIDHVRCGLGQEVEGAAKDVYGPTWPFSRRMLASPVFGSKPCEAPNCEHKTDLQAITGPRPLTLCFIYFVLIIYPIFTTVAYAGEYAWQGIIGLWVLCAITVVFVTLCAFTDPGIVPRRRLKNVTDRGDILIVRVPAPNAQAVLDKLLEAPDAGGAGGSHASHASGYTAEALRQAVADGDISASVFNHKRTTVYSMERYFETDTGRIVPYNPRLSESDLAVPTLEFPILFCRTCQIAKGPRTHHCKVCNNCVDEMDHHCPWTNSCIGRNNYPFFFGSLFFLHVMVLYALVYNFAQNIRFIVQHPTWDLWRQLRYVYGLPMVVYITFFFFGLFFFPLLMGHVYMTCQGLTTTEMLKKKWKGSKYFGGVNPWSQKRWYQNVHARLFRRWPAAKDDPLRWLDSRYYCGVAVAAAVEDQKVDWLIALPPEERQKVEEREAAARAAGAQVRVAQEAELVESGMKKRGFHVA